MPADPEGGELLPRPDPPDDPPGRHQGVEEPAPDPVQGRGALSPGAVVRRPDPGQPALRRRLDLGVGEAGDAERVRTQLELAGQVGVPGKEEE